MEAKHFYENSTRLARSIYFTYIFADIITN